MEYLVGVIVALLGGLFYFKGKADKNAVDASLAEIKGRDRELAEQQALAEQARLDLERGIKELEKKKAAEKAKRDAMTLKQRADEAKKRYKK